MNINEQSKWYELTTGAEIYEPATSREVKTGEWRTRTPVFDKEKCRQCMLCAPYCPDAAIKIVCGKMNGMDMDYCKGCGICSKVCPFGAIEMKREDQ